MMKPVIKALTESLLDSLLDLVVGCSFLESNSEVNNLDINGGNTEGHSGQLPVELWKHLSDSLGSSSAAGNDVE